MADGKMKGLAENGRKRTDAARQQAIKAITELTAEGKKVIRR